MAEVVVDWTLTGMRNPATGRYISAFASGSDLRTATGGAFATELELVAEGYMEVVRSLFSERHGRTGETAASIHTRLGDVTPNQLQYAVEVDGHVGFVINPIGEHPIEGHPLLGNIDPAAPAAGRVQNFYLEFGQVRAADWFQGGPESYSPDTSWYTDAQALLDGEGKAMLQKVANIVRQEWGTGNLETLAHGSAVVSTE